MTPSASAPAYTRSGATGTASLSSIESEAKRELSYLLDTFGSGHGKKMLVLDPDLRDPLDLVVGKQFLERHGVVGIQLLNQGRLGHLDASVDSIVFVSRPQVKNMDVIARMVKEAEGQRQHQGDNSPPPLTFHLIFIPNITFLCEKRLETLEVLGSFQESASGTVDVAASISWFPLDTDLISLERPEIFREFYLDKDPTCLHSVARAVVDLQILCGFAPRVYGKGQMAKRLWEYVKKIRAEAEAENEKVMSEPALFDTIVVLDRQVDLVSPFMTQLTYEGLIDEFYKIGQTKVRLPDEVAQSGGDSENRGSRGSPSHGGAGTTHLLNSSDELFADLRDRHFQTVAPILQRRVKSIAAQEQQIKKVERVSELKMVVKHDLPQHNTNKKNLDKHLKIATLITEQTSRPSFREFLKSESDLTNNFDIHKPVDFIEDAACQDEDMIRLLRLMCIQSQISHGLKPKILEAYKRLCLQSYGHSHLLTLLNLEKSGLLTAQPASGGSSSNYAVLRKRLNLTSDNEDPTTATDFAYVHNGYAPLSIRLVQQCFKPRGWQSCKDVLEMLPGPTFEEKQGQHQPVGTVSSGDPKRCLVLFIGGCTFAEVSALRFLSQQEDSNVEYTVATTAMTNGNFFISGLAHELKDPLGLSDLSGYVR